VPVHALGPATRPGEQPSSFRGSPTTVRDDRPPALSIRLGVTTGRVRFGDGTGCRPESHGHQSTERRRLPHPRRTVAREHRQLPRSRTLRPVVEGVAAERPASASVGRRRASLRWPERTRSSASMCRAGQPAVDPAGSHQLRGPSTCMRAGTRTVRTTKASMMMAAANRCRTPG